MPLLRMRERYESAGFKLAVIEARPPYNLVKLGSPGRDAEIDSICALIENMGRLRIPVWCYEWMTDFNWLRTNTNTPARGGSVVTSFDAALLSDAPPTELGPIGEDALWDNLEYFLRRVVPVAEKWNVKLACTRTIHHCRPFAAWDASRAVLRITNACWTSCPVRSTASPCARATSH
jgi:mannonate dehydratase